MAKQTKRPQTVQLEIELNNLRGEIETSTISNQSRQGALGQWNTLSEQLKGVLSGQFSPAQLEEGIEQLNRYLAEACLNQAEQEIPRSQQKDITTQALAYVRLQLKSGGLSPAKARREIKQILRHHSN